MSHRSAIYAANAVGFALLMAILFGWSVELECWIGVPKTLRDVSIGLWGVLLPAWFLIEERWAPEDEADRRRFLRGQQTGRVIWTAIGAAILGVVVGGAD